MRIVSIYLLFFISWIFILPIQAQEVTQTNYRNWVRKPSNKKLALVIGNSEYQYGSRLRYPANNANTIKAALEVRGYDVVLGYNLDKGEIKNATYDFADKLKNYESALIYYAGHGLEIEGENYLVPIDANPDLSNEKEAEKQVERECFNVKDFFKQLNAPDKPKVIILDACRANPFAYSGVRSGGNGMRGIQALENSILIFSTAEGTVVNDNNPFTEIFSEKVKQGGCVHDILEGVRKEIKKKGKGQQIWSQSSLLNAVCFGEQRVAGDSDGDGVMDAFDDCPLEAGSLIAKGCPDDDEDGVPNDKDLCPQVKGNPPDGCRVILQDTDQDGLIDEEDECPYEKGLKENQGCPLGEIKNPNPPLVGTLKDNRDHHSYKWILLKDGKKWMAENLRFETTESWCYKNDKNHCGQYGRLYTWKAAQKACPKGWRLASQLEWKNLQVIYGGSEKSYTHLLETNASSFGAKLGGYRSAKKDFSATNSFGNYWTSTEMDSALAAYASFNGFDNELFLEEGSKKEAYSCRCIELTNKN